MNVAGWCKPQAAGKLRPQVADNVAEKIAGDDDVELARIADNLHRQGVDIQMAGVDVRVLLADFLEDSLPEVVCKGHGIGFVAHAHALQAIPTRVFERVADDALDPFAGVHVLLNGNLVGGAFLKEPANAHVQPFRVLSDDHQANVFFGAIAQWRQPVVEQFNRSSVDVKIKLEAQAQKDIGGMLIGGDARVAQRAKENGVKLVAQHLNRTLRQ